MLNHPRVMRLFISYFLLGAVYYYVAEGYMAFSRLFRSTAPRTSISSFYRRAVSTRLHVSAPVSPAPAKIVSDNVQVEDEDLFGFDLPTNENSPQLLKTRHTAAHIMAMAVQNLHKDAQITIGPWIDNG